MMFLEITDYPTVSIHQRYRVVTVVGRVSFDRGTPLISRPDTGFLCHQFIGFSFVFLFKFLYWLRAAD